MRPYDLMIGDKGVWIMELWPKKVRTLRNMRRTHEDLIDELVLDMGKVGQLAPILLNKRVLSDRKVIYELIGGFHRLMAKLQRKEKVLCFVYDNLTPQEVFARMVGENIHRDPDSTEWAAALDENFQYWVIEGLGDGTVAGYCRETGLSPTKVHNAVRFMQRLDERAVRFVYDGHLSYGVACEIARIDDQEIQYNWARDAIAKKLDHKTMRTRVSGYLAEKAGQTTIVGNLFSDKPYQDEKVLRRAIDPLLERAALTLLEWLKSLAYMIDGGHFTKDIMSPRRRKAITDLRKLVDWIEQTYSDGKNEEER